MKRLFFCGGFYGKSSDPREKEFGMVRPTGGAPYVCDTPYDAQFKLFPLCQHHGNLYELKDRVAIMIFPGGGGETQQRSVDLTPDQVIELLQAPIWSVQ